MKRPKAPKPTAQEKAVVERQSRMLDETMEENEKRLKALARGKLGSKSLLANSASKSTSGTKGAGGAGRAGAGYSGGLASGIFRQDSARPQISRK
tara:strand:+ start:729 stop:1013 length:285 start_codon:yes stop_codon:yes gene_type:complete